WKQEYGAESVPNYMSVGGWDSMDAIYKAIIQQKGKLKPEESLRLIRNWSNPQSPRGPTSIDPETGDVVHNVYIRETKMEDGKLANIQFKTYPQVKDPWKAMANKNK